ncbi:aldo/keto reductase [candidate division KSB1 bacterium]
MQNNFREYRTLGRTGLKVSRLGIASGYGIHGKAVETAFHEHGINYFYWSSPRKSKFGDALKNLAASDREKMVIVFQTYDRLGLMMHKYHEKGLRSLNIDYADVLLLGWFNRPPGGRVIETALKLKEQGKVKFLAMSGHNRKTFAKMAQDPDSPIDIYMIRYNAVHKGAEEDIFPHLPEENRPGITIYTATCWRKLMKESKMPSGEKPLTAAECYRFVLSNPNVDLCMTGPRNDLQLKEALTLLDSPALSDEELHRIRKIGDHIHRR